MVTGRKINNLLNLGAIHALYFHRGDWYHHLKKFPGVLIDSKGYLRFETEKEFRNSKNLKIKSRVNINGGISTIKEYTKFSREQLLKIDEEFYLNDEEIVLRRLRTSNLLVRNRKLTQELKKIYSSKCQICNGQIRIDQHNYYIEAHHIKPLGEPHNGPDLMENMLCVCPNCHVLLDYNAIILNLDNMVIKHKIDKQYVDYHNSRLSYWVPA